MKAQSNNFLVSIKHESQWKATEVVLVFIMLFNVAPSYCCMGIQALPGRIYQFANI